MKELNPEPFRWHVAWCALFLVRAPGDFYFGIQLFRIITAGTHWPVLTAQFKQIIIAAAIYPAANIVLGQACMTREV